MFDDDSVFLNSSGYIGKKNCTKKKNKDKKYIFFGGNLRRPRISFDDSAVVCTSFQTEFVVAIEKNLQTD